MTESQPEGAAYRGPAGASRTQTLDVHRILLTPLLN